MRSIGRYLAALLAVLTLLAAALLALAGAATTSAFMQAVYGSQEIRAQQQERIGQAAETLATRWHIAPETLSAFTDGAAGRHAQAVADWWGELWSDPEAEPYLPVYLDATAERNMVNAIMQDEGFRAATDENHRRAIARDEVAYALDEAVCEAVTPLRRSVVELGISFMMDKAPLPLLRQGMLLGAAVLAAAGLLLLIAAHRAAGSALTALGGTMLLCAAGIRALDIPGMLAQLSPAAAQQGRRALTVLAMLWLGTAAVVAATGLLISGIRRVKGRKR